MACINAESDDERQCFLTSDVKNALVRDLVTTMYAFNPEPNSKFCKQAAEKLVKKYPFMRDVGPSGHVSWSV